MVESLSEQLNKQAVFKVENSVTGIPFLAKIKSPIIHLIRNALDHGIEDQYERLSKNKTAAGNIFLKLNEGGSSYTIEVEDDGSGIDFDRIRQKAVEKKLVPQNDGAVTKSKLLQLIFRPSFSSKNDVTEISGRGYGLDIVKDAAEQLHGTIQVRTKKDIGTKVTLTIPK